MNTINWGILSTGTIAKKFAATLTKLSHSGNLAAVGSRSQQSAAAFAAEYNIPKAYASYLDLVNDPAIDVIYIASPHSAHYENARLCLEHGKHVLCEKSFTVNRAEAQALIELAEKKKLFIMEAFWTKFVPAYEQVAKLVASGAIGTLTHFRAQYGFKPSGARYIRKFDPQLAGGALLDIGVYALGVAAMLLGYEPKTIASSAILGEYGTDEFDSIMLTYENGSTAHLITAIGTVIEPEAVLYGTKGHIALPDFTALQTFTVVTDDGTKTTHNYPFAINGFEYQIGETERCLQAGKTESSIMTHQNTLAIMELLDKIRGNWGLTFPCE
jgi:predicted dehydrogenase